MELVAGDGVEGLASRWVRTRWNSVGQLVEPSVHSDLEISQVSHPLADGTQVWERYGMEIIMGMEISLGHTTRSVSN